MSHTFIIIIKKGWQCKTAIKTQSVQRPQPHKTNAHNERKERAHSVRQWSEQLDQ